MRVALLLSLLCAVHADYYRKLENASCADCDVPATLGFCPRSLIVKEGGLDAGKCADIGYTVAKGKLDQKAGPCGTLHFKTYSKAAGSSNTCSEGVAKLIAVNGTLPEPRECVQQGLKMQELVKDYQCTASARQPRARPRHHGARVQVSDDRWHVCSGEGISALLQRDNLVRSLGIVEHVYR